MAMPLVRWCLQMGIDHRELSELLKPLYLEAGRARLAESGVKITDSALSLLTGLHRKEIRQTRASEQEQIAQTLDQQKQIRQTVSMPAQMVARWLTQDLPMRLPWQGEGHSFYALAQSVSRDVHPKALLNTMQLQGVVSVDPDEATVQLLHTSYTPAGQDQAMLSLLGESIADHMAAGLNNMRLPPAQRHLEQSVFADELSAQSVDQLERLATQLWHTAQKALLREATQLCEQDQGQAHSHWRFRAGSYSYSTSTAANIASASTATLANPAGQANPPAKTSAT